MNPFGSQSGKRQAFREFIDSLSKEAFEQFGIMELVKMNISKKTSQDYRTTEAQVNGFLEWLPRYQEYKDTVRELIEGKRHEYKLPL